MNRLQLEYLTDWINRSDRKPLLIRGARQVGKSYLVREFARREGLELLEFNFEERPELASIILEKNKEVRSQLLESHFKVSLQNIKPLLFLDELQAAPEIIPKLRYLYEHSPELPTIGAGSLLDFALKEHEFSMPVGRIENLFMGPLTFEEFLDALGEKELLEWILKLNWKLEFPEYVHRRLMELLRAYYLVGGMPEAVARFAEEKSYETVHRIHQNLLTIYQDDFNKYRKHVSADLLRKVFRAIPGRVGKKMVYSQIDAQERSSSIGKALDLLSMAKIIFRVQHAAGNGVPLGSEVNAKYVKPLFLDVGLMSSALGLNLSELSQEKDFTLVHQGAVSEQFIGQHLLYSHPFYQEPELYTWVREKAGSMAEVDYLISDGTKILPVEVKAGKSGKLKSLQVFVSEKKPLLAVRFSSENSSIENLKTAIPGTAPQSYRLLNLPLFSVGQLRRLLAIE